MSDFLNGLGKIAKGIGNAYLDSVEDDARRLSKDKRFSEEQRDEYAKFGTAIHNIRNRNNNSGSSYNDDEF